MPIDLEKGFFHPEGPVITTPRLSIREFTLDDVNAYHDIFSNPEVTRYLSWGPYTSMDQTANFIQRVTVDQKRTPRKSYEFAIVFQSTDELIGYTILQVNITNRSAERGIYLKPAVWNKGLATEAQSAMLDLGFDQLGLHRIWATCDPDNLSSQAVMKKTGMTYEGRLRESRWNARDQTYRDSLLFSILNTEWAELRSNPDS